MGQREHGWEHIEGSRQAPSIGDARIAATAERHALRFPPARRNLRRIRPFPFSPTHPRCKTVGGVVLPPRRHSTTPPPPPSSSFPSHTTSVQRAGSERASARTRVTSPIWSGCSAREQARDPAFVLAAAACCQFRRSTHRTEEAPPSFSVLYLSGSRHAPVPQCQRTRAAVAAVHG